jgi:hypothetical protein
METSERERERERKREREREREREIEKEKEEPGEKEEMRSGIGRMQKSEEYISHPNSFPSLSLSRTEF